MSDVVLRIARTVWAFATLLASAALTLVPPAGAEEESAAVLEFGAAGEWDLQSSTRHIGPSLSIEFTPIEHWLELEAGVSALRIGGLTEWESELLFKKPYELSQSAELMVGLGPTWTHSADSAPGANAVGAEFALDLMLWTSRRWGWYVEPSYGVEFAHDHGRAVGVTAGILIALP